MLSMSSWIVAAFVGIGIGLIIVGHLRLRSRLAEIEKRQDCAREREDCRRDEYWRLRNDLDSLATANGFKLIGPTGPKWVKDNPTQSPAP